MSIDATICVIYRTGREGLHMTHGQLKYKGISCQSMFVSTPDSIRVYLTWNRLTMFTYTGTKKFCTTQKRIKTFKRVNYVQCTWRWVGLWDSAFVLVYFFSFFFLLHVHTCPSVLVERNIHGISLLLVCVHISLQKDYYIAPPTMTLPWLLCNRVCECLPTKRQILNQIWHLL